MRKSKIMSAAVVTVVTVYVVYQKKAKNTERSVALINHNCRTAIPPSENAM